MGGHPGVNRGDVYEARLDPIEGSEQSGVRPVVIVSRDALNESIETVVAVPCSTMREGRPVYPNQALLHAPDGGLSRDSVALCEQVRVLAKPRLVRFRGTLSPAAMRRVDLALAIALDLD